MTSYVDSNFKNGMKVVRLKGKSINGVYDDLKKFVEAMPSAPPSTRKVSLDVLKVTPAGYLSMDDAKKDYRLSEASFNMLMNYLTIPIKFISRTPSELTVPIVNRFLSDSLVCCDLSFQDDIVTTVGKAESISNVPSCKLIFDKVLEGNEGLEFCFGIREDNLLVGVFSIGDPESYKDKPIPAIEIAYCADKTEFPSVTGMMLSTNGHASFSHLKRVSNPSKIGNKDVVESMCSHAHEIKQEVKDAVTTAHKNLEESFTVKEWATLISAGSDVFGTAFKVSKSAKVRTPSVIFKKIEKIKESKKFTLEEKRQHALYLGKLFARNFN